MLRLRHLRENSSVNPIFISLLEVYIQGLDHGRNLIIFFVCANEGLQSYYVKNNTFGKCVAIIIIIQPL